MNNLFLINETVTSSFLAISLNIVTVLSVVCSIFVIVSKNPIVSVLYLIGLFLNIAVFLILQGLNFIGLAYLLVYVGAVSILFLFILMLINVRISEIVSSSKNSMPLGVLIGTVLYIALDKALPNNLNTGNILNFDLILPSHKIKSDFENLIQVIQSSVMNNVTTYNQVMSHNWDGALTDVSHIAAIGNVIYTSYSLWLILVSLILLLAMVGTIVITIKKQ